MPSRDQVYSQALLLALSDPPHMSRAELTISSCIWMHLENWPCWVTPDQRKPARICDRNQQRPAPGPIGQS